MKRYGLIISCLFAICPPAFAQTAGMQSFQGLIRNNLGQPVTAPVNLEFYIYDTPCPTPPCGGTVVAGPYSPSGPTNPITPTNGIVGTKFGPVPASAFNGSPRYLEVRVNGTPLSRVEIATPPGVAERLDPSPPPGPPVSPAVTTETNGRVHVGPVIVPERPARLDVTDTGTGERTILTLRTAESQVGTAGRLDWAQSNTVSGSIVNVFEGPGQGGMSFHTYQDGLAPPLRETMRIANNGNVGIGTATPLRKLDVAGYVRSNPGMFITPAEAGHEWWMGPFTDATAGQWQLTHYDTSNSSWSNALTMNTGNNLGIGTTTPERRLEVRSCCPSASAIRFGDPFGVGELAAGSSAVTIRTENGLDRLWINQSNGNVGIGAPGPQAPLHVVSANPVDHTKISAAAAAPFGAFLSLDATAISGGKNYRVFATGASAGEGQGKLIFQNATDGIIPLALSANGNVGINTTSPTADLEIRGAPTADLFMRATGGSSGFNITSRLSPDQMRISYFDGVSAFTDILSIGSLGRVGIGTTSPDVELHVNGHACKTMGGNTWSSCSDIRLKRDIKAISESLTTVLSLRGVTFHWKKPNEHGGEEAPQMGFLAQEVERVVPQWVSTDSRGLKWVNPAGFDALAVEAMRELKKENDALRKNVNDLEWRLAAVETLLARFAPAEKK